VAEEKDNQQPEKPAETPAEPKAADSKPVESKPAEPKAAEPKPAEPKAAVPKPPPPPPGAKPAAPAAPPKPKGPVPEPWTSPLVDAIKEKFGDQFVKSYSFISQNQIEIKKDRVVEVMTFLRDNTISPFNYLVDETAVHWPKTEEFEVVYILYSFAKNERIRVKTRIKEFETIDSVFSVWSTADWLEREVYDMFGVRYQNHPNLKRILLPEDWVGFPLRKDYNIRLQDVEWVRKHLGIESGQKYYVGEARHDDPDYITPSG
jgi:NADH-quinone oxidoreductase subunit C